MRTRWIDGRAKRCIDVVVGSSVLVLTSPLLLVAAGAVRVRLGSPVLIRQQRAGRDGRPILVPKLRSMSNDRDREGRLLPDDQRTTRFGRVLRASSLDELPQLWSVVVGDMSLAGPRPLPMEYVPRYGPVHAQRLTVRPGVTGWAQVHGRNAMSWRERLDFDVWYVEHASFRVDLQILWRTFGTVFRRHGVSAVGHVTMPEFLGEE